MAEPTTLYAVITQEAGPEAPMQRRFVLAVHDSELGALAGAIAVVTDPDPDGLPECTWVVAVEPNGDTEALGRLLPGTGRLVIPMGVERNPCLPRRTWVELWAGASVLWGAQLAYRDLRVVRRPFFPLEAASAVLGALEGESAPPAPVRPPAGFEGEQKAVDDSADGVDLSRPIGGSPAPAADDRTPPRFER